MRIFQRPVLIILGLSIVLLIFTETVAALSLKEAKARGCIGEKYTGYLGVVDNKCGHAATVIVNHTNRARQKEYQAVAKHNKVTRRKVERLAGKVAIVTTPTGYFIDLGDGWEKKVDENEKDKK